MQSKLEHNKRQLVIAVIQFNKRPTEIKKGLIEFFANAVLDAQLEKNKADAAVYTASVK